MSPAGTCCVEVTEGGDDVAVSTGYLMLPGRGPRRPARMGADQA
jgi:hypothetical protein